MINAPGGPISTHVISIDHTVQNDSADGGEFHMLMALKLDGITPASNITPGTTIHQPG